MADGTGLIFYSPATADLIQHYDFISDAYYGKVINVVAAKLCGHDEFKLGLKPLLTNYKNGGQNLDQSRDISNEHKNDLLLFSEACSLQLFMQTTPYVI